MGPSQDECGSDFMRGHTVGRVYRWREHLHAVPTRLPEIVAAAPVVERQAALARGPLNLLIEAHACRKRMNVDPSHMAWCCVMPMQMPWLGNSVT